MNQGQDNRPVSDEEYFKDKKESQPAKYTAKDSVFTDLFRDKKYLLQLYQALHPEDKTATDRKSTRLNSSHTMQSRMPSSA